MNFLDFIPEYIFESLGLVAGVFACVVIAIQIIKEYKSDRPSSLSPGYVVGWGIIFLFWGLYGVRFGAIALWLTNAVAVVLQIILTVIIFKKKKREMAD